MEDRDELTRARTEIAELQDKHLRLLAEFDNYKKRVVKERADLLKYQGEKIFADLLEIVDNFELALQNSGTDLAQFRTGVEMIYKRLLEVLGRWEVRGESGVGKEFDPERHSAISRLVLPGSAPNTIVDELKKAFFYKDKLLRAAEVVVAVGPGEGEEPT